MKKERKADNFLPKPIYPGGPKKLSLFVKQNLKYPKDAEAERINGTVRIRIEIDYKGVVMGSKILSGLTPSCNEEAERVVKLLKFEVEQKLRKGKIRFSKTLNIKFTPPSPKPPVKKLGSNKTVLSYKITKTKSKQERKTSESKPKSYEYVIKF